MKELWKVGELAKSTGLTVRTLHHYDQIGLLKPSNRTSSGYRLYCKNDIERLQQILSLRSLGFSLEQIKSCFNGTKLSPLEIIEMHLEQVRKEIKVQEKLRDQLERIARDLKIHRNITVEKFIKFIEVIKLAEKYPFTPEQMEKIKKQGELLGQEKIQEVQKEWPDLIAKVTAEMEKGTPPSDPKVQKIAKRWRELVNMFTGGDTGIESTLAKRYKEAPGYAEKFGMSQKLFDYVGQAMKALK
ncbi:MerR family transcriptional regulator [Candidatus Acetothermia bacterium]|nr:MerR family transcriptional regulator [Candidatus Acetothermia bacterium]MBI3643211.1 MerR family transcriptional regulator [Candidatus Acetothermia bacterium]